MSCRPDRRRFVGLVRPAPRLNRRRQPGERDGIEPRKFIAPLRHRIHQPTHLGMGDDVAGVVEQERQSRLAKPLLGQQLLQPVEQEVACDDAAAAFLELGAERVTGLTGGEENVRTGQQGLFVLEGIDVPRTPARIVTGRTRHLRDRDQVLGQVVRDGPGIGLAGTER